MSTWHSESSDSGGGQGAGARESRGRERAGSGIYMRAGSGIYIRAWSGSRNKEGDSLLFITEYYSIKNTYLAKFENSI